MLKRKSDLTKFIYFCEDNNYCSRAIRKKKEEDVRKNEVIDEEKTRDFFINLYRGHED